MNTTFFLMAQYGRMIVPVDEVCRDYFTPHTLPTFLRKVGNGEIPLPVVRLDDSQKGPKGININDLAAYLDKQSEAARKEARKLAS